jgi:uncharacterized protein (TIGR02246 family)
MRFMILVKATKDSEAGAMPPESLFRDMANYHDELQKAGMLLDASGLQPTKKGWRIGYTGQKRTFTDGPFAETKEIVAGYTLIQAKSREEAIEWTKCFPNPSLDGGTAAIEVRQVYEIDDFAPSREVERFRAMDTTMRTSGDAASSPDQADIKKLIEEQVKAICAKDVERIMKNYAPDVTAFDVKPPTQIRGVEAWRRTWAECLPYFPQTFGIEMRDVEIDVSGDLAYSHWIQRFTGPEKHHPAQQMWLRITGCYKRSGGAWRIVHEHVSVPFDPMSGKAVLTLEREASIPEA